jgi:hypothetical protein
VVINQLRKKIEKDPTRPRYNSGFNVIQDQAALSRVD